MSWLGLVLGGNALEKSQRRGWQDEGSALSFRSYGPGRYLAGQEGFEPSTNRLTADRTTSVLLTLNAKSPARWRGFE